MNLNNNKAIIISSRVGCKRLSIHPCGLPYIITKRKYINIMIYYSKT